MMETVLIICSLLILPLAVIAAYYSFRCFRQAENSLAEVRQAVEQLSARTNFAPPRVLFEKQIALSPDRPVTRLDINLAGQSTPK